MIGVRQWVTVTFLAAAAALPGTAAAQGCGLVGGTGIAAIAGFAAYDFTDETSGPAFGLDGDLALTGASVRASVRRLDLDGRSPDLGRLAVAVPLPLPFDPGPISLCGIGHAGAARLPVDDETTTAVAGGAGLRIAARLPLGGGFAVPYGEVRGLAARTTGRLFGVDIDANGQAVGVEGGVQAALGWMTLRLAASVDGFDDGLGVTPYPNTAAEVAVGIRF